MRHLVLCLLVLFTTQPALAAITLFGTGKNASGTGSVTVTPPASMVTGDFVVVLACYRTTGSIIGFTNNSGQPWASGTQISQGAITTCNVFYAVFNGTWSGNPTLVGASMEPIGVYMMVFSGVAPSTPLDVALAGTGASPGGSCDATITGFNTVADNAVPVFMWWSQDDNDWAIQSGPTLTQPETQWYALTLGSFSVGYFTQTPAGATGDSVNRQIARGCDDTIMYRFALKPLAPHPPRRILYM